jgi:aspartate/methionine/tyrosine aminotransferase
MPIEIESPEQFGYNNIKCNLAESSMRDRTLADLGLELDLNKLVLQYGDHRGHPGLRELLAAEAGSTPEQVLLTPGAAGALFIAATSLLTPRDHLVVLRPNYATNIETPRAIGCELSFVDLQFENGFQYSADDIAAVMKTNTKLVSITTPHNPTGTMLSEEELKRIINLVEEHGCYLLVDETYRSLSLELPPVATTLSKRVISVGSLSKTYGLPGLRLGWLIARDNTLAETLLAAKEQIVITGPVIEEEVAYQVYQQREVLLARIRQEMQAGLHVAREWITDEPLLEWVEPAGGVVCFPRIKQGSGVDANKFHQLLNTEFATFVGPGHWFEQDKRYMRLGYGWPTPNELRNGLENISKALRATVD